MLDCKNLQIGTNKIALSLKENGSVVRTVANTVQGEWGWFFDFIGVDLEDALEEEVSVTEKTAVYTMTVDVKESCIWEARRTFDIPEGLGSVKMHHNPDDELIAKIEEEEEEPEPSMILADGQKVSVASQTTDFEDFVSTNTYLLQKIDEDLTVEKIPDPSWYETETAF